MNFLGNIIWLVFGGFFAAIGYVLGGLLLCVTIVGIPFGLQCFKIAGFVLMPFGKTVSSDTQSLGCISLLANVIWIFSGGWITALNHLFWGVLFAITIVGIPFAMQHFKLIELSLMPFGKKIT